MLTHDPTRIPTSWGWAMGQMFGVVLQAAVVGAVSAIFFGVLYVIDHINWEVVWKP